jgi:NADPH:quinone reductase-like Zn-dependent oxidoreductase
LGVRAAVNTQYGGPDVVQVRDVPMPRPGPGEVLVRVFATSLSRTDCGYLRAHPFFLRFLTGLRRPKETVLGMDFAGEVVTVGAGAAGFAVGDRVFGLAPGDHRAHAEYVAVPADGAIAPMPAGLSFAEAVVCEGALYADSNLRSFGLRPGDSILVYGASGAIGTAAVQLAKSYGAIVTAVTDTRHRGLVASLGADRVVDYTAEDFTQLGLTFDFVLDAVGKAGYLRCRKLLKPRGVFAATDLGPWDQNLFALLLCAATRSKKMIFPFPKSTASFVEEMRVRMEKGEFRAVIDRRFPLERVQDAYRYVETGQKTGIVVIDVVAPPEATTLE